MSSNRPGRNASEASNTSGVPSSAPGSAYRGPGSGPFDPMAHGYALQPTQYPASVIPHGQPTGPIGEFRVGSVPGSRDSVWISATPQQCLEQPRISGPVRRQRELATCNTNASWNGLAAEQLGS